MPKYLQEAFCIVIDQSHDYRRVRYWSGDGNLLVVGKKMEPVHLPDEGRTQAPKFSGAFGVEMEASRSREGKVLEAFRKYAGTMEKARYSCR